MRLVKKFFVPKKWSGGAPPPPLASALFRLGMERDSLFPCRDSQVLAKTHKIYNSVVGAEYASPAMHMCYLGDAYVFPSYLKKSLNVFLQRSQSSKSLDKTTFCSLEGLNTY